MGSSLALSIGRPAFVSSTTRPRASQPRRMVIRNSWSPFGHELGRQQPQEEGRFRSIFSAAWIPPSNNPATVEDARDALEACSGLWGEERSECLSVFGLDGQQIDTYYSAVWTLEQALSRDTDPEEEASHRGQERC